MIEIKVVEKMLETLLKNAISRHFSETRIFISSLSENSDIEVIFQSDVIKPDQILFENPVKDGRVFGEIIFHLIRSMEFYITGIATGEWKPLPYSLIEYSTVVEILNLYDVITNRLIKLLEKISPEILEEQVSSFNRNATKGEILLEMLEHSIHHRGQLTVYMRLLGKDPPKIPYIV